MASIIYHSPLLYHCVMRMLHGRHFTERYLAIAAEVPAGASVVELCAGDAWLYWHHLRQKNVSYLGLDNTPAFLAAARARGIELRAFDVLADAVPAADIVIMQASLHLFPKHAAELIQRMLDAARQQVIIAEPIRNMADSPNALIAWLGRIMSRPHGEGADATHRYTAASFEAQMRALPEFERVFLEKGGREMVAVLKGRGQPQVSS